MTYDLLQDPATGAAPTDRSDSGGPRETEGDRSVLEPAPTRRRGPLATLLLQPTSLVVLGAVVVGTVLRLLVPRGIWLDEAISVHDARLPYGAMLHTQATTDVHPPLYFTILWLSGRAIGFGEFAIRLPSIILGVTIIPLAYLLGKEAYDRRTGAVTAVLVAFAPLLVWYSQETRMYMLLMVLGVCALWAQLRILRRSGVGLDGPAIAQSGWGGWGGWWPWIVYTVCTAGLAWTQYFGLWQVAFQQAVFVVVLVVRWRRHRSAGPLALAWVVSAVIILATLVPLAALAHQQFSVHQSTGQAFGVTVKGADSGSIGIYSVLTNVAWGFIGYHSDAAMATMVALWPVGMLIALGLLGRRPRPVSFYLVGAVVTPIALMFALGMLKSNLFEIRYMSTIVPVLFLLTARAVTAVVVSQRVTVIVTLALVVVLCVGLVDQQTSSTNPRRYDFREAVHLVDAQARPGDIVYFRPSDLWSVVGYYGPGLHARSLSADPPLPSDGHRVFLITSPSLMDGTTDQAAVTSAIDELGAYGVLIEDRSFPNVRVRVYK